MATISILELLVDAIAELRFEGLIPSVEEFAEQADPRKALGCSP